MFHKIEILFLNYTYKYKVNLGFLQQCFINNSLHQKSSMQLQDLSFTHLSPPVHSECR